MQIIPTTEGIKGELEQALGDAGNGAGEKTGGSFVKSVGGAIAKGAAVVGAAAATAVGALTKSAVEGFADYEQLVGGVDTLFKESSDTVQQYASNAFKTAGLSANEYMETVTSFSASLLQSLDGDTAAAAAAADLAITDMADNANKMGTSMESIQNAYQGFAKQNYTMLDNLKLGYGGTKEEMQRLLEDAEKLSGVHYDMSSLADVYEAIHVVQTELGITGTTAIEASETISGSAASMKAAWSNMVVGIADDNADFEKLTSDLVESAGALIENLMPRIQTALSGVAKLITDLAPVIVKEIPGLVQTVLPELLKAATSIVKAIVDALPDLLPVIIKSVIDFLVDAIPELIDTGIKLFTALVEAMPQIIDQIVQALPEIISSIVTALISNIPAIAKAGLELLLGLIKEIPQVIAKIGQTVGMIIKALVDGFKNSLEKIKDIGKNIVEGIWTGIKNMATTFANNVKNFFTGIVDGVKSLLGIHSPSKVFAGIGGYMAEGLGDGFTDGMNDVRKDVLGDVNSLVGNVSGMSINSTLNSAPAERDTFYFNLEARSIKELNDLVRIAQSARFTARMGVT